MARRSLPVVILLVAIGVVIWCLLPDRIIAPNTDVDEGVFLMTARLLHRGYDTHNFFFDQFWFFPKILVTMFTLFGDSLLVGRLTVFAFSLAGLAGIAMLSRQLSAKWGTAVAAILICAADPLYIRQSRMVMADVPAMTCLVWSLVCVFSFQKDHRRFWIALSGLCAGASLLLKPFAVGFIVTIAIVLLAERTRRENGRVKFDPAILVDAVIFSALAIGIALPFINLLQPIEEFRRTVGFHLQERNWLMTRADDRWRGLYGFIRLNIPPVVFAIAGIAALRPISISIMALIAGGLVTTMILLEMPPWIHHYVLILPPLVIFSVLGFERGLAAFKRFISQLRTAHRLHFAGNWAAILFATAVLTSLIDLPWLFRFDRRARFPAAFRVDEVVQYAQQNFRPDEYLLSDDSLVLYLADRLMPPAAINFSYGDVLKFDPASFNRLEQIVRDNHVAGVITTTRFPRNPRLMSWVQERFPISVEIGAHHPDELTARVYSADKQQP
jgi:4-amino-4-deoxy-L-arabinose transferase-like glycosyltransferase